ncbi:MAG: hypothetical protein H6702_20005 [Myxococcales bacterium]|nr:hypothetical protein [Myxococcales bacterium]
MLAQAVAQLHRGDADGACVTLETARALAGLDDDYWAPRARWLTVAARALAGDPAEAEPPASRPCPHDAAAGPGPPLDG